MSRWGKASQFKKGYKAFRSDKGGKAAAMVANHDAGLFKLDTDDDSAQWLAGFKKAQQDYEDAKKSDMLRILLEPRSLDEIQPGDVVAMHGVFGKWKVLEIEPTRRHYVVKAIGITGQPLRVGRNTVSEAWKAAPEDGI